MDLFISSDNKVYADEDIKNTLCEIGIEKAKVLFMHSDIMFGRLCPGIKRNDYLEAMYRILASFDIPIIVPAFTYSFCNGEDFDVAGSRTSMGVLNEYIRKQDGYVRTKDPLLSFSVPNSLVDNFKDLGHNSLGPDSAFDRMHNMDGVYFLFYGAELPESFTYVHHVEKILEVPYRFDMGFTGDIIDTDGSRKTETYYIHTQCKGARIPARYDHFEKKLLDEGLLKKRKLGDKSVALISERDAYRSISDNIKNDRYYYVEEPYEEDALIKEYTYDRTKGRITHC